MTTVKLMDLVDIGSETAVWDEAYYLLKHINSRFPIRPVRHAYQTAIDIYNGDYPGYQACNTDYHDLKHSIGTFLAMAQIIYGATQEGHRFSQRNICRAMIAALFHDVGFIQEESDIQGTGAKYTLVHVRRSMDFMAEKYQSHTLKPLDIDIIQRMILCTDLNIDPKTIDFPNKSVAMLAKMVGSVDLLAQMSDPLYLEKLISLYLEFEEGKVVGFKSPLDLLRKTGGFYDLVDYRLTHSLDNMTRFLRVYFAKRWHIDENMYQVEVRRQKQYRMEFLAELDANPHEHQYLRRGMLAEYVDKRNAEY